MPSGRWQARDRRPRAAARSRRARAARPSTAPYSYLRVVHWVITLSLSLRSRSLSNCSGFVLRLFFARSDPRPSGSYTYPQTQVTLRPARSPRFGLNNLRRAKHVDACIDRKIVLPCRICAGTICGSTMHTGWPEAAPTCTRRPPGHAAIPLIERGAVARTFDTPGFRGMTFFEVQAKSVVNRVPEASRMPFRWTINPYRGCQHSCVYCQVGETPILMADGRTKPLADVRAGDEIYGTYPARLLPPVRDARRCWRTGPRSSPRTGSCWRTALSSCAAVIIAS